MRRKDKEVLDQEILHQVINHSMVCRIGLVNDDRPYVIPISFGFDGKNIYFHSALQGEKVEILKKNKNVCIEFEQDISIIKNEKPCNWSARYLTVIVHGTADLVADPVKKRYGLSKILAHYGAGENHIFTDKELQSVLVYQITVKEITGKMSGMSD